MFSSPQNYNILFYPLSILLINSTCSNKSNTNNGKDFVLLPYCYQKKEEKQRAFLKKQLNCNL